ncbi:protease inhibitor I9 family protein [Streptomyces sp. NPDC002138]|uniref:protease inhibitor I9 family protein n=1 Tax=Streptomyces sp. NPDC002138 TaxID=3154410 RepID=UPI0033166196
MRNPLNRARALSLAAAVLAAVAALPGSAAGAAPRDRDPVPHAAPVEQHPLYIVTVDKAFDPAEVARRAGVKRPHVYHTVLNGFAAPLSPTQVTALRAMPGVEAIEEDGRAAASGGF